VECDTTRGALRSAEADSADRIDTLVALPEETFRAVAALLIDALHDRGVAPRGRASFGAGVRVTDSQRRLADDFPPSIARLEMLLRADEAAAIPVFRHLLDTRADDLALEFGIALASAGGRWARATPTLLAFWELHFLPEGAAAGLQAWDAPHTPGGNPATTRDDSRGKSPTASWPWPSAEPILSATARAVLRLRPHGRGQFTTWERIALQNVVG
jgi:hypothetical protein